MDPQNTTYTKSSGELYTIKKGNSSEHELLPGSGGFVLNQIQRKRMAVRSLFARILDVLAALDYKPGDRGFVLNHVSLKLLLQCEEKPRHTVQHFNDFSH